MRVDILGVGFDNVTMDQAVAEGLRLMSAEGAHYVATPNPEIVEVCREDPEARAAVNGADLVIADGVGVIYGAKLLGTPLKERLPGIEFAKRLMAEMAKNGKKLYLLGAKPGVAEEAARRLRTQYPGLVIAGTHDGYFQEDGPVTEAIRGSGADVVFVCWGLPSRKNGCGKTARPPAPICWWAWGDAWTCFPARSSGPLRSFRGWGWSGSTGWQRTPAALAG